MGFARGVWRLLVGIKDALALIFLILFFSVLAAALASTPNVAQVRDGALLLKLEGSIVEEAASADPLSLLLSQSLPAREYAARDLVRAIDEAASDDRIKAIALDLTTFTGGAHVSTKEVAEALARFRAADKPIVTYAVAYSDDAMMLAAQSNEIWIDPLGGVAIRGPGGTILFYADALERFNIKAHVYQVGAYKGTGEPYTNAQMSPEMRENTETYVGQLWEEYLASLKKARPQADLDAATTGLIAALEANGGDLAQAAKAAGLVDTIGTRQEWGAHVAELAGKDEWDDSAGAFAHTTLDPWLATTAPKPSSRSFGAEHKQIAVITVAGEISDGDTGPGSAGAARITRMLDNALKDEPAALVVRIDSPGGTVTGSEAIRRSILPYKAKGIPVVISMSNYAASGGYWISTAGDHIFAEPETVTGSIGVVLVVPSFEELLAEYGVNAQQVQTTPLSGQPDVLGGFSDATHQLLQYETNSLYSRFVGMVAQARKLTPERADELAQGRIWTGGSARQLGLIDQFGNLDNALEYAAKAAELEEGSWDAVFLSEPADPFEAMLAGMLGTAPQAPQSIGSISGLLAAQEQQVSARILADFDRLLASQGVMARCLECAPQSSANTPSPAGLSGWRGSLWKLLVN